MDAEPITFTGRLSEQDAVDMHHYRSLCQVRPTIRWLIGVVMVLLFIPMVAALVLVKVTAPLVLITVFWVLVPSAWWYSDRFSARAHYRRYAELYVQNTVTITPVDVALSNANYSVRMNWNQFSFLSDTPKGLLFVVPPMQTLCWLPQRLFEGNSHKTAILGYAAANNIRVRPMK